MFSDQMWEEVSLGPLVLFTQMGNVGGYERGMGMDGRNLLYLVSFGLFCLRHLWDVRLLFKSQL